MKTETVRIKLLAPGAKQPVYGSDGAAGADLFALTDVDVDVLPGQTALIGTGISMEIPEGFVGLVFARSGLAAKSGLAPANKVGVIDSDYRGEIKVALHNHSGAVRTVKNGDRIAQIVIAPYVRADFVQEDALSETGRADGGFGSTGTR
ncbi:MAG: dUTP diphosphatase [Clostridia bacterium]|nr:dUTP diphosphatase [Clostridia bacterium]